MIVAAIAFESARSGPISRLKLNDSQPRIAGRLKSHAPQQTFGTA
jgi:hypothetical protein